MSPSIARASLRVFVDQAPNLPRRPLSPRRPARNTTGTGPRCAASSLLVLLLVPALASASTESWQIQRVDDGDSIGNYNSIALDSNDRAHISYCDWDRFDLRYATNASGRWASEAVDRTFVGWYTSIALDSQENVHVSYQDIDDNGLKYATNASGQWVTQKLTTASRGDETSIAVDSRDSVHISSCSYWNGTLEYTTNESGIWETTTIDDVGWYQSSSIALDSNDRVYIAYHNHSTFEEGLCVATSASGVWVTERLDDAWLAGLRCDIAVDSNDKLHISYTDVSEPTDWLKYATNVSGTWVIESLAPLGIPNFSRVMHNQHADKVPPTTGGCHNCHTGHQTQCLRDVMSTYYGLTCLSCHGAMEAVAENPDPWLNEPRCDSAGCHGSGFGQDQPLYRNSVEHGGIYCEGCHDSTHAIAPSRKPNDALKFLDWQGYNSTLTTCTVCHATQPVGAGPHGMAAPAATLHVSHVVLGSRDFGAWHLVLGVVRIVNETNQPLTGATARGEWTLRLGQTRQLQATTNAQGLARFTTLSRQNGQYQLCATSVSRAGYLYDPDQNVETCDKRIVPQPIPMAIRPEALSQAPRHRRQLLV